MKVIKSKSGFLKIISEYERSKIFVIRLPNLSIRGTRIKKKFLNSHLYRICQITNQITSIDALKKTVVFIGPMYLLPYIYHSIDKKYKFQHLVALRIKNPNFRKQFLSNEHLGLIIFSTLKNPFFNEVKLPYQYCKCCKNTVKDYGGKRHLLNSDGTRISDVWKEFDINESEEFPRKVLKIITKFTLGKRQNGITCLSLTKTRNFKRWNLDALDKEIINKLFPKTPKVNSIHTKTKTNIIFNEDVMTGFKKIPNNVIDLALVDPPYNLSIKYGKYRDNKNNDEYLAWNKNWIDQISRTMKNGGLLFFVNIPQWTLEIFPYLQSRLSFQGWIVWSAWSMPGGRMVPSHYPILCFSKGENFKTFNKPKKFRKDIELNEIVFPLNYGYCIRSWCIRRRTHKMKNDRKPLSDLWYDTHRIRHNSFRYNHPTLMPQKLAKRIMLLFSNKNDLILDCFNGVGTTTLVAQKLRRNFIGIEKNHSYYKTSVDRHSIFSAGGDPFEKTKAKSTSINKGYRPIKYQTQVPKTVLQLEVKNVAKKLGHCPSKSELRKYGKYPLRIYYDNFRDWPEITVATRRTGIKMKRK